MLFFICLIILFYFIYKNQKILNDNPNLEYIPDFLTHEDCDYLINLSKDKFQKSTVVSSSLFVPHKDRTNYSYFLPNDDPIVKKIKNLLNTNKIEGLQIVRYLPGQEFKQHHDYFTKDYPGKQRLFTYFVYLNTLSPEQGGETYFPLLNKKFSPKKGHALFWRNCYERSESSERSESNGTNKNLCLEKSLHSGMPLISGEKYGLNIWVTE